MSTILSNQQLLGKFAPIVQVHPHDASHPSSVEWYLQRCNLLQSDGTNAFADGGPIISPQNGRSDTSALADTAPYQRLSWYIKIINNPAGTRDTTRQGPALTGLSSVPCYGYVRPMVDSNNNPTGTDLDYWFFYPFNGDIASVIPHLSGHAVGLHDGDWEYCTVRLDTNANVVGVFCSQHSGAEWHAIADVEQRNGQIVIYSAKNSHANYFDTSYHGILTIRRDKCVNDPAGTWDTSKTVIDVGWQKSSIVLSVGATISLGTGSEPAALAGDVVGGCLAAVLNDDNKTFTFAALFPGESLLELPATSPVTSSIAPTADAVTSMTFGKTQVGTVVAVCRDTTNNQLLCSVGTFPKGQNSITWNTAFQTLSIGGTIVTGGGVPSICIADMVGQEDIPQGNVFLEVFRGYNGDNNKSYYVLGTVDPGQGANPAITVWSSGPYDSSHNEISDPQIAISGSGAVLEVHCADWQVYYTLGQIDASNKTIAWNPTGRTFGPGLNPKLAMTLDGEFIVVCEDSSRQNILAYAGYLGTTTNTGDEDQTAASALSAYLLPIGATTNGSQAISATVAQGTSTSPYTSPSVTEYGGYGVFVAYMTTNGPVLANGVLNAFLFPPPQRPNSTYWMDYSGRWGPFHERHGKLDQWSTGPEGPAFHSTYVTGPT